MIKKAKYSVFGLNGKIPSVVKPSILNISDNSLTDLSLVPCVDALSKITNLTELDLSSNSMGPKAAKAISDYLSCSHCPLKKLTIQNSDVNDYQCEKFITALQYNSTLLYLDLSNNKIGNAEALNVVKPNLIMECRCDALNSASLFENKKEVVG